MNKREVDESERIEAGKVDEEHRQQGRLQGRIEGYRIARTPADRRWICRCCCCYILLLGARWINSFLFEAIALLWTQGGSCSSPTQNEKGTMKSLTGRNEHNATGDHAQPILPPLTNHPIIHPHCTTNQYCFIPPVAETRLLVVTARSDAHQTAHSRSFIFYRSPSVLLNFFSPFLSFPVFFFIYWGTFRLTRGLFKLTRNKLFGFKRDSRNLSQRIKFVIFWDFFMHSFVDHSKLELSHSS